MRRTAHAIVNGLTLYRLVSAPLLLVLLFTNQIAWFKWLLPISFLTDALDGYLARTYKVVTVSGSRLDSIADQLTILAVLLGLLRLRMPFVHQQIIIIGILIGLYGLQTLMALVRYGKISSFHTYLAKIAATDQALFFVQLFYTNEPILIIFYTTASLTVIELAEECLLVLVLPNWKTNVKGLYWVLQHRREVSGSEHNQPLT